MEFTPATVLSAATLIFVILGFAFGRGDKGLARVTVLEAKQIADNATRKEEISNMGHQMELNAVRAAAAQEANHRDTIELKRKVDEFIKLIGPLLDRLGMHMPAVDSRK